MRLEHSDGLPCGNFAIMANVSRSGRVCGAVWRNPGKLHTWLQPLAETDFRIRGLDPSTIPGVRVERAWPFCRISGELPDASGLGVRMEVWAPLQANTEWVSALPCVMVEIRWHNGSGREQRAACAWEAAPRAADADLAIRFDAPEVPVPPGGHAVQRAVLCAFDPEGAAARAFGSAAEIAAFVLHNWEHLRAATAALEARLPFCGDAELDDALRWYTGAGVFLTKCTRAGAVLTMGYKDLNQRDSYWTSWLHLVLWPSLERRMLEASASAIGEDGKLPTCILPQIYERPDDLDINAYFVLRVLRFVRHHDDLEVGYRLWPACMRALRWLEARAPDGLPVQGTYWGDWKDVKGIEGRRHSPHACLLYLAALERMQQLGRRLDKTADGVWLAQAVARCRAALNRAPAQGGLWNGAYYVQAWRDGRADSRVLQDQCVGILFGVVDAARAESIFAALAPSRCPYGVAETWPVWPADFGYAPGTYHNGGVWPWLTFADAWARLRCGRRDEALAMIRDTARADLFARGDHLPHEHLNAFTGENLGKPVQAWNACLFGAFAFGLRGMETP